MSEFRNAWERLRIPTWEEIKEGTQRWIEENGKYYAISTIVNVGVLLILAIIGGSVILRQKEDPPNITAFDPNADSKTKVYEVGKQPNYDPSVLDTATLTDLEAKPVMQEAEYNDDSEKFEKAGGGTAAGVAQNMGLGMDIKAPGPGPLLKGGGGVEAGIGDGNSWGSGGNKTGFGGRGSGHREFIPGVTAQSERAVAAALHWISRHQADDGSWKLDHTAKCKDGKCNGPGQSKSDAGATALALLPFLAAGQTHESKGPYQTHISKGVQWLIKQQKPDGDLSGGSQHQMYTHGLAAIAMCEAFGMTSDSKIRSAAQNAIKFIETAQNPKGGWRYTHGTAEADTSVLGWQVMALKSAQMAGLEVNDAVLDKARSWLRLVGTGTYKGLYPYMQDGVERTTMTGVGLLCSQYLGAQREEPHVKEGMTYLMAHMPGTQSDNDAYYWYYATQAMHNMPGPEWEKWNRAMRKHLIDSQVREGCATGSWDPAKDLWGSQGGRLMITSLSCLTLEVYYRYLPLYKLDKEGEGGSMQPAK